MEFAEDIMKEAYGYNGFNLIIGDLMSMNMVYVIKLQENRYNKMQKKCRKIEISALF